jgi:hypothetical protein
MEKSRGGGSRFTEEVDLFLLHQVLRVNPFASANPVTAWLVVSQTLFRKLGLTFSAMECSQRIETLLRRKSKYDSVAMTRKFMIRLLLEQCQRIAVDGQETRPGNLFDEFEEQGNEYEVALTMIQMRQKTGQFGKV